MDPVDLEQLHYELRSPALCETVSVSVDQLTPGCVIATGAWSCHIVTALPQPLNRTTALVPIRHMHGGHSLSRRLPRAEQVSIFRPRLDPAQLTAVPVVPRCFVPDDPATGDRVIQHWHTVIRLGEGYAYEYTGQQWERSGVAFDGTRSSQITALYPHGIRHLVSDPAESSPFGYFTYLPAGHRPHLYMDGVPMPARTADQLHVGDVLRLPGHGRLEVIGLDLHPHSTTVRLQVLKPSTHSLQHFMWQQAVGGIGVHEDSGRTHSLYATEPRPDELLSAADLQPLDTVITAWGTNHSVVTTVDDVWRQPVRSVMHVHSTGVDGRHWRSMTGLDNRYILLHRPACHSHTADTQPLARSHA